MNNKGSILIWTMFVSLFIVSFFVVFQWSFLNFAKTSEIGWEKINSQILIEEAIHNLKLNPTQAVKIWKYSIKSLDYNGASYRKSLWFWESTEFLLSSSWWLNSLICSVSLGWPLRFEVISYDSWGWAMATIFDSWVINPSSSSNIWFDADSDFNIIWIRSLGWTSEFSIEKGNTNLLPPVSLYSLYQDFSTWSRDMRNIEVVNYKEKTLPIDYKKFWVFLNSSNYD